jgi:hypothetical protein
MAKKGNSKTPEVLEPEGPNEQQLVATDGTTIMQFLSATRLVQFFKDATALEVKAKATLARAKTLTAPTTLEEDVAIQTFIKGATADKKTVEETWGICQVFSQVHRRLTAKRGIAVEALEDAGKIAQRLHNDYAEAERRRAAQEQEQKRQEAEAKARLEREEEARQLEAKALEAEQASPDLSTREAVFVDLVVSGRSPIDAAKGAGYKNPETQGPKLMDLAKIQVAIKAKNDAKAIREQAEATRQKPLDIRTETVKPAIGKAAGGSFDRTTHSAEVLNERLFIEAVVGGQHGIPLDCLTVNTTKLNEYARSLQERVNLWPGIRHKKETKTI